MSGVFDPSMPPARLGLSLLCSEHNRSILHALARQPMSQHQLKAWLVIASATTLHRHLRALLDATVVERRETRGARLRVRYELTSAGRALVAVLGVARSWLRRHPDRPLEPTSPVGWRSFAALVESWQLGLIQGLVEQPRSSADLVDAIAGLNAHKTERELARLAGAGVLRRARDPSAAARYALSEWGRLGIGVLAAAANWERAHAPEQATPVGIQDATAALIGALPLVRFPSRTSGVCAFTVEGDRGAGASPRAGAVWAAVRDGRVRHCAAGPAPRPPIAWARGSIGAWLDALIDGRWAAVQTGGEPDLSTCLRQLHACLCEGND